jgi:hypothetical protein
MKSRILSLFLIFSLLLTAGCQSDMPSFEASSALEELIVEATRQDFTGPFTRVLDTDYSTAFEAGDEIGILAFYADGSPISGVSNIKATYDGSKWALGTRLYKYAGATYMAYAPYQSTLSTASIRSISDLKAQFAVAKGGQNNLADYRAADLLVDSLGTVNDTKLTFSFSHAFSMVEIQLPRIVYTMKPASGSTVLPNYYLPMSKHYYISNAETDAIKATELYEASPNCYRAIVMPGEEVHVWGGYFRQDGSARHFSYKLEGGQIEAGECRSVKIDPSLHVAIDFKYAQGDYYMADGTLMSKNESNVRDKLADCIGVIFYANSSSLVMGQGEKAWLNSLGIGEHGYVVALRNAYDEDAVAITGKQWGPLTDVPDIANESTIEAYLTDNSGYDHTLALAAVSKPGQLIDAVTAYREAVPVPSVTTGWFLPTAGQWQDMIEKFASLKFGAEDFVEHDWSEGRSYYYTSPDLVSAINKRFEKFGEEQYDLLQGNFWTSNELSASDAVYVKLNASQFDIFECHKGTATVIYTRCFLAF